jgi:hypothetical protein
LTDETSRKYRAKTLILNATGDRFVPKKISLELANGISGAELVFIEGITDI